MWQEHLRITLTLYMEDMDNGSPTAFPAAEPGGGARVMSFNMAPYLFNFLPAADCVCK